jgi:hypothetical protein
MVIEENSVELPVQLNLYFKYMSCRVLTPPFNVDTHLSHTKSCDEYYLSTALVQLQPYLTRMAPFQVIVSIVGLLLFGKLLEPLWGAKELLKFIFIVNISTSFCVFITAVILYYLTQQEIYL